MRNKKKILKYTYLLAVFIFYIVIMLLNQFNIGTREKLNKFETDVISLFREATPLYVIVALLGVVILNGLGFRDIFGFTNFFIIVISKFLHDDTRIQIIISIMISGVFMALEKFIRYYYFSTEIQFLLSKPFEIILCCLKWIGDHVFCCIKIDFSFFTTKYLILISDHNKHNVKYNIIYNFRNKLTKSRIFNKIITIIISVIWLTFSEWISPFKELILFVHNWSFTWNNILLLIFSEFFDIDNIIEIILMIRSFDKGKILETRFLMIIIGIMFSVIGYIIFFIPTLYWIKKYYYKEIHEEERFF
tara:strand:- start:498 stop:1409 length:912 start_codon:yes stop_codon:yes gene_type:complete